MGQADKSLKQLPADLLILNRFGIGFPYLKAAHELSQHFDIPPFEVLVRSGIISEGIWFSAQKMLKTEREKLAVQKFEERYLLRNAICGLETSHPEYSAKQTFTPAQLVVFASLAFTVFVVMFLDVQIVLKAVFFLLALFYLAGILLRLLLIIGLGRTSAEQVRHLPIKQKDLPVYTVLVALYKEAEQVPELSRYLQLIDWPVDKLDIKLVCESDDFDTVLAVHDARLPSQFELVLVPPAEPRTKPKALNYALPSARGEFLVLYDAEDRPHPAQLKEAYGRFLNADPDVACLQAPLSIYNHRQNWLCRMFSIEYLTLFGGTLPVLAKWQVPIPLGGTSNHFRTDVLRKIGAWDPYNVTEDADLGIRLFREGFRCETLTSPTYEEAPPDLGIWIRQRTRWMKGWMQTILVHMRDPSRFHRQMGSINTITFHLLLTSIVVSVLAHPIFLVLATYQVAVLGGQLVEPIDGLIVGINYFNLIGGYTAYMFLALLVLRMHRSPRINSWFVLSFPLYWLLISIAAWRAFGQLIVKPHHWEKTPHGLAALDFHHFDMD